jgi:predicted short-subunit dehydrogenase-like oxidoreductase (DUF2520 family)
MQSISVVGIGRVGGALALALAKTGYTLDLLIHRDEQTAKAIAPLLPDGAKLATFDSVDPITSDIVVIATADPEIPDAARQLADSMSGPAVVLHTSGSLSSEVLSDLAAMGCATGSLHPLVSITDATSGVDAFSGAYFCIEGDDRAVVVARSIATALNGKPFSIPTDRKPLYHAAAVAACGHVVALIDIAIEMLAKCGVGPDAAKEVLMPLIKSTVANLESRSTSQALTGSFARADVAAVERHLAAMEGTVSDAIREIYIALGERSIELAAANNVDADELDQVRKTISIAKRKPEC